MFEKGDYVVYGSTGICVVIDVASMEMAGAGQEKLYYRMEPYGQSGRKIFAPVDNPKMKLRRILSREEALKVIDQIPSLPQIGVSEEKLRELVYKEHIRSCDCVSWVRMVKTLYIRRLERERQGKKVTVTDEKYYRLAENYLYTEFSLSLDLPKQQVQGFIAKRLEYVVQQNACSDTAP